MVFLDPATGAPGGALPLSGYIIGYITGIMTLPGGSPSPVALEGMRFITKIGNMLFGEDLIFKWLHVYKNSFAGGPVQGGNYL